MPIIVRVALVATCFMATAACTGRQQTHIEAESPTPARESQQAATPKPESESRESRRGETRADSQQSDASRSTTPVGSANSSTALPAVVQPPPTIPPARQVVEADRDLGNDPVAPQQPEVLPQQPQVLPQQPQVVPQQPITQPNPQSPIEPYVGNLHIPITPFSNMEKGYQATNPGFRAILKDSSGKVFAAGPITMDSVINGSTDDATRGSAYGRLVLNVGLKHLDGQAQAGAAGEGSGKLTICMASDSGAKYDVASCQRLTSDISANDRPFQWFDVPVSWTTSGNDIRITRYSGQTGEGGTPSQIALSVYHPAYGFAAPGKAFKDYQSPLVLDMNANQRIDLTDVWDESRRTHFDVTGVGKAYRTGWVAPGDGLLALDFNSNGRIDSGVELFGEFTARPTPLLPDPNARTTFENGFLALAQYDENVDGVIDVRDGVFARLIVWRDRNGDGISTPGELSKLDQAGIASISLAWKKVEIEGNPMTVAGNEIRVNAQFTTKSGETLEIADVWFMQRRSESLNADASSKRALGGAK